MAKQQAIWFVFVSELYLITGGFTLNKSLHAAGQGSVPETALEQASAWVSNLLESHDLAPSMRAPKSPDVRLPMRLSITEVELPVSPAEKNKCSQSAPSGTGLDKTRKPALTIDKVA